MKFLKVIGFMALGFLFGCVVGDFTIAILAPFALACIPLFDI